MAKLKSQSLLDSMLAGPRAAHPHLTPYNGSIEARAGVMQGLEGLMEYQRFLADARAVKARRRRVPPAFERNMQRQSRHALSDLSTFMAGALDATGQVNQSGLWQTFQHRVGAALGQTGQMSVQDLWRDIRERPQVISALASLGFTEAMAVMNDKLIATVDVAVRAVDGQLEVKARRAGERDEYRAVRLSAVRTRPKTVTDLIGRLSFDQLATAFARGDSVFIAGPPDVPLSCEPGELVALGAFASRQIMIDHVRKLEDAGLATYSGGEPTTLLALALAGLALYILSLIILHQCKDDQPVSPPDEVCTAGWVLMLIGLMLIVVGTGGLVLPFVESAAVATLIGVVVASTLFGAGTMIASIWGFSVEQVPPSPDAPS